MNLSKSELMIIERLLQNRINEDYDKDIDGILQRVKNEINKRNNELNEIMNWMGDAI